MRRMIILTMGTILSVSVLPGMASAADGKSLSNRCISCHGNNGIGTKDEYPNLAGQKSAYLFKQMQAFQSGKRSDPIMGAMVKGMSEADLKALADYYSKLR